MSSILACSVSGVPVTVRIRPQVINLLAGEEAPSYSFDLAGRLFGAYRQGRNYRRGFDNRILEKWRGPDGRRQRRWLAPAEAQDFLEDVYRLARHVAETTADPGLDVLRRWDWPALEADAARFAAVYRPVSILPPDQYLATVLQATLGCSHNRCTFCDFYRDRTFQVRSPDEFRAHVAAVQHFLGPAARLRQSLFLADANALVAPMPRLRAWLDIIEEAFGERGIYSFVDAFHVRRKSLAEWAELRAHGLRRVYIGMESGDDELLRFLRKPGCAADVIEAVSALKAAGIAASVIVMIGIGGDRYAAGHVANTVAVLNALPLAAGDIVYFSPFVDRPGSEYGQLAAAAGLRALTGAELSAQESALRAGLRPYDPSHPPRYAPYDIREFVY